MMNFYKGGRGMAYCQGDKPTCRIRKNTIRESVQNREGVYKPSGYSIILFFVLCLFNDAAFGQSHSPSEAATEVVSVSRSNVVDYVNIKDVSHLRQQILHYSPKADLEKYPLFEYKAIIDSISPLSHGKPVPDEIWDLPLRLVNGHDGQDSTTLRELAGDKSLVLDFWSTWCKPCLESMDKWKRIQPKYNDHVQVVGLMMDYDYKAEITIEEKNWTMPQIVGPEVYLLNAYFCSTPIIGPSAWINNNRFIGVTGTQADTENLIKKISTGEFNRIPDADLWSITKTQ